MAQVTRKKTQNEYKKTMKICIITGIFFLVIAGIYAGINWKYMVMGNTTNLNEAVYNGGAPEEGEYVTLNVRFVLGNYAETKHKRYFITTGTDQHYAIILDDGSIMSVKVKKQADIDALEDMVDPTWKYINQETKEPPVSILTLTGRISTMDSQIKGFYEQALTGAGINSTVVEKIHQLTLDATETRFSQFLLLLGILAIAIVCFIGAIASRRQMKKLGQLQDIARQNAADPSLNPFLAGNASSQNPFAGDSAQQNPYAADVTAQNTPQQPYAPFAPGAAADASTAAPGTGTEDVLSRYTPAERQDVSNLTETGINFPGAASDSAAPDYTSTNFTTPDSATSDYTTPDYSASSVSDSYPETSIDDYNDYNHQ